MSFAAIAKNWNARKGLKYHAKLTAKGIEAEFFYCVSVFKDSVEPMSLKEALTEVLTRRTTAFFRLLVEPRIQRRLNRMGIYTLGQLGRAPVHRLRAEFGITGLYYHWIGQGLDPSPIDLQALDEKRKSYSHARIIRYPYKSFDEALPILEGRTTAFFRLLVELFIQNHNALDKNIMYAIVCVSHTIGRCGYATSVYHPVVEHFIILLSEQRFLRTEQGTVLQQTHGAH